MKKPGLVSRPGAQCHITYLTLEKSPIVLSASSPQLFALLRQCLQVRRRGDGAVAIF
jgi:hypothetical protein